MLPSHESQVELKYDIISKVLSYTSETKNYCSFRLIISLYKDHVVRRPVIFSA